MSKTTSQLPKRGQVDVKKHHLALLCFVSHLFSKENDPSVSERFLISFALGHLGDEAISTAIPVILAMSRDKEEKDRLFSLVWESDYSSSCVFLYNLLVSVGCPPALPVKISAFDGDPSIFSMNFPGHSSCGLKSAELLTKIKNTIIFHQKNDPPCSLGTSCKGLPTYPDKCRCAGLLCMIMAAKVDLLDGTLSRIALDIGDPVLLSALIAKLNDNGDMNVANGSSFRKIAIETITDPSCPSIATVKEILSKVTNTIQADIIVSYVTKKHEASVGIKEIESCISSHIKGAIFVKKHGPRIIHSIGHVLVENPSLFYESIFGHSVKWDIFCLDNFSQLLSVLFVRRRTDLVPSLLKYNLKRCGRQEDPPSSLSSMDDQGIFHRLSSREDCHPNAADHCMSMVLDCLDFIIGYMTLFGEGPGGEAKDDGAGFGPLMDFLGIGRDILDQVMLSLSSGILCHMASVIKNLSSTPADIAIMSAQVKTRSKDKIA